MEPLDEHNLSHQRFDSIAPDTAAANAGTPRATDRSLRDSFLSSPAFENSSAGSGEDTADDSFASVITVVPLQRVGRSLWQPPGSPGAAVDPPRASTDSFRARPATSGLRPRQKSDASDPFVDSRSRAGTAGTTGSSTPLLGVVPVRPERAHTVQRGREQRRDLSGGRQSIETTPSEAREIIRSPTHTTATNSTIYQTSTSTSNSRDNFGSSLAGGASNPTAHTTSFTSTFNNVNTNLSSPLRSRTDSTIAMKDGQRGPDDLSRLTPGEKQRGVIGSIKRGINNLGSIRGRRTPKADDDETDDRSGEGSSGGGKSPGGNTIKKKKSLGDLLGSIKKAATARPRAQAAFELQTFPSEQSMIGGLLLHGPQHLELAKGGDGRYTARHKNGAVFPPRLPLEPRTEPRRGDPREGRFLSPGTAFSGVGPGHDGYGSASRSPGPDRYANKPLPPLPPQYDENGVDYEEWKKGGKSKGKKRGE